MHVPNVLHHTANPHTSHTYTHIGGSENLHCRIPVVPNVCILMNMAMVLLSGINFEQQSNLKLAIITF